MQNLQLIIASTLLKSPYLQYLGQHDKRGVLQLHLYFVQQLCDAVVCSHTVGGEKKDEEMHQKNY